MSENQAVGLASKVLYDLGSEYVEAVNAISGERCNPHPHVFPIACCGRAIRFTTTSCIPIWIPDVLLPVLHDRLCVACDDRCVQTLPEYLDAAISLVQPGGRRRRLHRCGRRRRSLDFRMKKRLLRCSSGTASAGDLGEAGDQPDGFAGTFA